MLKGASGSCRRGLHCVMTRKKKSELIEEIRELRAKADEAEEALRAIRSGEVDALIVAGDQGDQVFTLKGAETPYRVILESISEGAITLVSNGVILYSNEHFSKMLGLPLERILGASFRDFVCDRDRSLLPELFETAQRGESRREINLLCASGDPLPVHLSLRQLEPDETGGTRMSMVISDISDRKRSEEALRRAHDELELRVQERTVKLRESEEHYRVITESAQDAIITVDDEGTIMFVNPATEKIFGYRAAELTGKSLTMLMPERFRQAHLNGVREHIATGGKRRPWGAIERPGLHKDGREIPLEISYGEVVKDGRHLFIGIVRDVSERKKAEETIRYQAYHDLPTGLPNKANLMDRLELELAQAERNGNRLAVLHIDLDRFKVINDTLGHLVGDKLVLLITERLKSIIRKSDTLARFGSDEFIVLVSDLGRAEDAAAFARKLVNTMQTAFEIDGHTLYITVSVGISIYPEDGVDPESLLRNADVAISHVKETGRNNYEFFDSAINVRTVERLLLESNLRESIERDELVLHYQPLVSIKTGEIMCLEALVRWDHPVLGLLQPGRFIPIAEEIGFIAEIDKWVIRTACTQLKKWHAAGLHYLCVTVNLSAQQFEQSQFLEIVSGILRETGLGARYLNIEIPESTAMRDIDLVVPNLEGLNDMGISIYIDDFGTGYSSLNYLKRFPIHKLKIDKSFIKGIGSDQDDRAIVSAVIAMGHNLRLNVIAEGVETEDQLTFLKSAGCDEIQGFLFSKPLPAEELTELVEPG
ncbi:MAG: hypothetical protein A2010_07870 [Nitrospirae bacterium GWD2_57_9]|nr:MAG: hypothetical protein A2010_07870 [Nitrospirae bacterium GWD2_57_9]OGW47102.1 MAG: hypothetical protein A2078_05660 [Nitrospirae bacterium GWC2_57_9]